MAEERGRTYLEDEQLKLRDLSSITGFELYAKGERVGRVQDILLDDTEWGVRFLSIDASEWLPDRKVLVSVLALRDADWEEQKFTISERKQLLAEHASLGTNDEVSRRFQTDLNRRFKWPPYWGEGEVRSGEGGQDAHLFSRDELLEYRLLALDGDAGQVSGFIVDEDDWTVYYLVIETGADQNPRRVLVSSDWMSRVGREEGVIYSDLSRALVRGAPEYDPAVPVTRDVELDLYDYYGRPHYWVQGDVVEDADDVGQGSQGG